MANLIFDLDGTLLDSQARLYRLFQQLIPGSTLSHESYWRLKRNKVSNETILAKEFGFEETAIDRFVADWMQLIEAPEYLALDKSFPGVREALEGMSQQANLHVCTARQHRQMAVNQLDCLGLLPYLDNVMVTEQSRGKQELIEALPGLGPQDWILGDTGEDIRVGQALGIRTCAVASGFLNEKCLRSYGPDLILPVVTDFRL